MLFYALAFFIISLVAGAFGFTRVSSGAATIAKVIFWLFLALFLGALVLALVALA